MTEREERLALNERVEDRLRPVPGDEQAIAVLCECADVECNLRIEIARAEYWRVRGDPARFVVFPRHTRAEIEDVVERTDRFEIVRKEVTPRTSPRHSATTASMGRAVRT